MKDIMYKVKFREYDGNICASVDKVKFITDLNELGELLDSPNLTELIPMRVEYKSPLTDSAILALVEEKKANKRATDIKNDIEAKQGELAELQKELDGIEEKG